MVAPKALASVVGAAPGVQVTQVMVCDPNPDTISTFDWVHSVARVGNGQVVAGSTVTPEHTEALRTSVLSTVVNAPDVQDAPGSHPIFPTIST